MDNDDAYMVRIIQHFPDEQVRNKAIERNMTLDELIEWQTTRERSQAIHLAANPETVNRINYHDRYRRRISSDRAYESTRYNDQANRRRNYDPDEAT